MIERAGTAPRQEPGSAHRPVWMRALSPWSRSPVLTSPHPVRTLTEQPHERNHEMPELTTILHLTQPGPVGGPIHLLASEIAGVLTERALLRGSKDVTTAVLMKGNEEPVRVAESVESVLDLWTRSIEGAWSA